MKITKTAVVLLPALLAAVCAGPAQAQSVSLTQELAGAKKTSLWLILGAAALLAVKFLIL